MFHVPGLIDGRYNLAFDSERNTSTLSEFIGYAELTDFREFLLKHSRDTDKVKNSRKEEKLSVETEKPTMTGEAVGKSFDFATKQLFTRWR